jgi:hypothetical protein
VGGEVLGACQREKVVESIGQGCDLSLDVCLELSKKIRGDRLRAGRAAGWTPLFDCVAASLARSPTFKRDTLGREAVACFDRVPG